MQNRIALITGAGSERGIGKAIAFEFARKGAIVVVSDINETGAQSVADQITREGFRAIGKKVDVTSRDSINHLVTDTIKTYGKIDILINNAGISRPTRVLEITEEEWDLIFSINMKGLFLCTQAVLPNMIENKYGRIVNLSSVSGKRGGGIFGGSHYSASKAGVLGFAKACAREMAEYGITINSVAPGLIDTDITGGALTPEKRESLRMDIPARRLGAAQDVAAAIAFLASEAAGYITGEDIDINGGSHMD